MENHKKQFILLALLFSVFMSIPWLVPHMGIFVLFGIVPLLCMDRLADEYGVKKFWMWHYSSFVLWNAFTTFWVCNATIGGGIFAILANSLQMSLIFGLFRFSKKRMKGILPYIFLAVMWIAWERYYLTSAQISWPWLVLGNGFARSIRLIQWYEYTGTLGGSAWAWAVNLSIFGMMVALSDGRFFVWNAKAKTACVASLITVVMLPAVVSIGLWSCYESHDEGRIEAIIAQPNLDPYQKFESLDQNQQTNILLALFSDALNELHPEKNTLLIAPETFTNDIICGDYESSPTWNKFRAFMSAHPGTGILFGASAREYYSDRAARNPNDYRLRTGGWLQRHNSAVMMDPESDTQIYHKSKLVVGVEMAPYPKLFVPLSEKLGAGIGRCVGQEKVTNLSFNGEQIGSIICYESIYGEFCTDYVKNGAKALSVITNDAWWGDTPGYKQHLSYSSLRAIELRRDIARCGNTGISGFIDQRGTIINQSKWWERCWIDGEISLNSRITFFASHGDIIGRLCSFIFILMLLALFARYRKRG